MWPDRVSKLGPLTYESGALSTALRGSAARGKVTYLWESKHSEEWERGGGRR